MFTAKDVMTLRERTGAGMMDCKKALTACDGDMEKAVDFLREKGLAAAAKKASRIAAEGIVESYCEDGVAAIVEINCETDFVAKTDDFKAFAKLIARQVVKTNPATVEELLAQSAVDDASETINAKLNAAVAKIGEKITVRRFARAEGIVDTYIHLGGKIGVIVNVEGEADSAKLHDVALQIAAANPVCVGVADLPADYIEHERAIELAKAKEENNQLPKPKPDAIVEKMVEGRMSKKYKEVCLIEQTFVKNPDITVSAYINGAFAVKSFTRFEMGEGLQKREDNFAEEVMSQMKA